MGKLHKMLVGLVEAEAGQRGYIITGNERFLNSYSVGVANLHEDFRRLTDLTKDDPVQQRRMASLRTAVDRRLAQLKGTLELRKAKGFEAAQAIVQAGHGNEQMEEIRKITAEMENNELQLLTRRIREKEDRTRATILINAVFVLLAVAVLATSFYLIRRDVADRKRAQDTLDRFFSLSPDLLCIAGFDGYFKRLNRAWEKVLGYTEQEILSRPWLDFVHPEDRQATIDIAGNLRGGDVVSTFENRYLCRDGSYRVFLWSSSPSLEEGLIYAVAHDITHRKQAEEEIRELNAALGRRVVEREGQLEDTKKELQIEITERKSVEAQLLQSQKMEAIGRLAGGIAHDFNNLLTVITGFSDLLLEMPDGDTTMRGYAAEIQKAGERAALLTRQLLAFSRRQILLPEVLDLNTVVIEVDTMLRRLIREDIELKTILSPGLGRVRVDPGQVHQILMNLAVNARDAMPRGGKLIIETANVELDNAYARRHAEVKPGPYVMLAVSDTGIGMTDEIKSHIFEPFFTTKEKGKGTGLGLATVYGIVKQSEGSIWIYSELGRGATFKIYLPRVEEAADPRAPRETLDSLPAVSGTILLVEDEPGVRRLARRVLESRGYTVLEAGRGDEALQVSERHEGAIHLLLTDVIMPGMSGRELADRLGPKRPETKLLFMSGYTDESVLHHGVLESGIAFVQKPFTPDTLAQKVREMLG
ncbi:MAG: CHASE3 domain-containing protein [Acidobacteria bacterium]|nr:CHASE3 domain-containing protein [Acidobacteriota bacterium]